MGLNKKIHLSTYGCNWFYDVIIDALNHIFAGLWKLANHVDFTDEELESIKTELHHFEVRLAKLQHLQAELAEVDARRNDPNDLGDLEKTQGRKIMDQKVETHKRKIEKMQKDLEYRITSRHTEL